MKKKKKLKHWKQKKHKPSQIKALLVNKTIT